MRATRVVWLSTSVKTRGGVASYVRGMQATPLWDSWHIRHIATHQDGSVAARIRTFVVGATTFMSALVAHRPALVHLHTASHGSFARKSLLSWIAHARRLPVVIHVHGGGFHDFFEASPRAIQAYIRLTLGHADAVIALGDGWAKRLEEIAPRARVIVVPNGVKAQASVVQPGPDDVVRVLFMGDISVNKGVFNLLDAWGQLAGTTGGRSAELVLIGAGQLDQARGRASELGLADQVRVLGWVAPHEAEHHLASSHVLALPSYREGQPMAVLEAMARGLCVVASDVGGIPDLIDADCGLLVPVGDVTALANALRCVITDEGERVRLGRQASCRVRERFNVDQTWRALDALYAELTE